jgi:hypothetical protein
MISSYGPEAQEDVASYSNTLLCLHIGGRLLLMPTTPVFCIFSCMSLQFLGAPSGHMSRVARHNGDVIKSRQSQKNPMLL